MSSFVLIRSEVVIQMCKIAKTVVELRYNRIKKEYEFQLDCYQNSSWWDKVTFNVNGPIGASVVSAAIKRDKDLETLRIIESGCALGENVYLSFEHAKFLADRQGI